MEFSRQGDWSGSPSPGDLPDPGMEPAFLRSLVLAGRFFTTGTTCLTYLFYLLYVFRY